METCSAFCSWFSQINWLWYGVSVALVYAIGALWYSVLFTKVWMRVFKIEMPQSVEKSSVLFTMFFQLLATAILGLVMFLLSNVSCWLAVLVLIGFCGWHKASLKFQFAKWKDFFTAAMIDVGYLFIAGLIFILFAKM